MLPRLVAVGPEDLADHSRAGRVVVLRRILAALRGERSRGRAGHWSYSLDRHVGLVQALAAERRALADLGRKRTAGAVAPDSVRQRTDRLRSAETKTAADGDPRRS